jgi:predicted transcriptional regulator
MRKNTIRDLLLRLSTKGSKKANPTRRRVKYAPVAQRRLAQHSCIPDAHIAPMERDKVTVGITRAKRLGKALNTGYKVFL